MNVLVTGGAGYVGSVLTQDLLERGHGVRVLDSLLHGGESLLGCYSHPSFSFVRSDIRDAPNVRTALDGIDAVVHLAAIVGDPACSRQPELARAVNLDASLLLYEACRRSGVQRFIFASTCSNYGRMAQASTFLTEESDLRPVSLYAETKVAVEKALLNETGKRGPAVSILRFATVFGLSPRMRFDLTVNEFTMMLLTQKCLTIYGEQFWRPYVHVRDVARAIILVLEAPPARINLEAFNVGATDQNFQKRGLVDIIRARLPHDVHVETVQKDEDPRDYRVSFEKIAGRLEYRITRPVEAGVWEIIDALTHGIFPDPHLPRYRN